MEKLWTYEVRQMVAEKEREIENLKAEREGWKDIITSLEAENAYLKERVRQLKGQLDEMQMNLNE